jgi:predicted O-methyltransferase YrrM
MFKESKYDRLQPKTYKLVTIDALKKKYPQLFSDCIGCLKGVEVKLNEA